MVSINEVRSQIRCCQGIILELIKNSPDQKINGSELISCFKFLQSLGGYKQYMVDEAMVSWATSFNMVVRINLESVLIEMFRLKLIYVTEFANGDLELTILNDQSNELFSKNELAYLNNTVKFILQFLNEHPILSGCGLMNKLSSLVRLLQYDTKFNFELFEGYVNAVLTDDNFIKILDANFNKDCSKNLCVSIKVCLQQAEYLLVKDMLLVLLKRCWQFTLLRGKDDVIDEYDDFEAPVDLESSRNLYITVLSKFY